MEKLLGPILQGVPGAIVIGVALIFFVQPVSNRVDRVVDAMNREVIPIINELKKKSMPVPELKPLAELSDQVSKVTVALADQSQRVRDMQIELQNVARIQEASAKEVRDVRAALAASQQTNAVLAGNLQAGIDQSKKVALLSAISPVAYDPGKTFKAGDVLINPWGGGGHFVVTDPQPLNAIKVQMLKAFTKELGLKPVETTP
jgi:hypothetical protein